MLEKGLKRSGRGRKLFAILAITAAGMTGAKSHVPPVPQYRQISFREFVVDGPKLARKSTRVELHGLYTRQGEEAVLYEDDNAYIMDRVGPNAGSTPTIPLLTDGASHRFREMQYSCDSQQAYGRYGCLIIVRGTATICAITNIFGVETKSPCIDVRDGSENDPPPPTSVSVETPPPIPASPPQTDTLKTIRVFQQKVTHCIRSVRMFGATDVYHKCVKRIQAETAASLPSPQK